MNRNKQTELGFVDRAAMVECLWGITERLQQAAAQPILQRWLEDPQRIGWSSEQRRAVEQSAFELAVAHGSFDLFDIPAPGAWRSGVLPPSLVIPAVRGGIDHAIRLMQNSDGWESRWFDCAEQAIQHELATSLLEQVIDLQAAMLSFDGFKSDQAMIELAERSSPQPSSTGLSLTSLVEVFRQAFADVEALVDEHSGPISAIVETAWANNLEAALPAASWQPRPWWLTDHAVILWKDFVRGQEDAMDVQRSRLEAPLDEIPIDAPQSAELAAAFADASHVQSTYRQFEGDVMGLKVELRVEISSAAGEMVPPNQPLHDLPEDFEVKIGLILSSDHQSEPLQLEDDQRWRLRVGLFIADFVCRRRLGLEDTLFGNHACTVDQLRAGWFDDKFCPAYLRRIA